MPNLKLPKPAAGELARTVMGQKGEGVTFRGLAKAEVGYRLQAQCAAPASRDEMSVTVSVNLKEQRKVRLSCNHLNNETPAGTFAEGAVIQIELQLPNRYAHGWARVIPVSSS